MSAPILVCAVTSTIHCLEQYQLNDGGSKQKTITLTGLREDFSIDDGGRLESNDLDLEDYDVLTVTPLYMVPVLTDGLDHLTWCRERNFRPSEFIYILQW